MPAVPDGVILGSLEGSIEVPIEANAGARLGGTRRLITPSAIIERIVEWIVRHDKVGRFPSGESIWGHG
ncbi:MAG: hypothetical protein ABI076_10800 [Acidobacteriaceae bacterium]